MAIAGIGGRIVNLRESKNWSQKELANKIDINASVMNRIESEERPIKDYELAKIAKVLETTSDYLLGSEPEPHGTESDDSSSLADAEKVVEVLRIMDVFLHDVENFKNITTQDIEEIKNHIHYVLYRAKNREGKK
jgi:transcriptional regulator with XRE-family HTH domain